MTEWFRILENAVVQECQNIMGDRMLIAMAERKERVPANANGLENLDDCIGL